MASNVDRCMKVIAINGSPRLVGNTTNLIMDLLDEIGKEGIETEQVQIYEYHLSPCNDCRSCEVRGDGRCIIEDDGLNEVADKIAQADAVILASPTYFGSCPGQMKIFLERLGLPAEVGGLRYRRKIGAALVVQEREGGTAVYSELVNFMLRNGMMVVGSSPITVITSKDPPQYEKDVKGCRAVKALAQEIAWAVQKLAE